MLRLFDYADNLLIGLFRLSDIPILGYYLGTALVCITCVVIGRITLRFSSSINERYLSRDHGDMVRMHNLSIYALAAKNKEAYTNCNKQANEAFGKVFFSSVALGSSALWPLPFALAWMQYRFGQVDFQLPFELPVIGSHAGFTFTFFPILILTYIVLGHMFSYLLKVKTLNKGHVYVETFDNSEEKLLSLKDIIS